MKMEMGTGRELGARTADLANIMQLLPVPPLPPNEANQSLSDKHLAGRRRRKRKRRLPSISAICSSYV